MTWFCPIVRSFKISGTFPFLVLKTMQRPIRSNHTFTDMVSRSGKFLSCPQKFEETNQPKCESLGSIKTESRHPRSGLSTVEWQIGSISKRNRHMPFLSILVALTISVTNPNRINVASHNMHGFSTSSSYLNKSNRVRTTDAFSANCPRTCL